MESRSSIQQMKFKWLRQRCVGSSRRLQHCSNRWCVSTSTTSLHRSGICGDDLINHPVAIAFTSKLNSLCRLSIARESAAFDCLAQLQRGEPVDYEIIPIN